MSKYDTISRVLERAIEDGTLKDAREEIEKSGAEETRLADVLLNPENQPLIVKQTACSCPPGEPHACEVACLFDAIERDENGHVVINSNCTGCGECVKACPENVLAGRKDSLAVLQLLKEKKAPVYAMIAPAFTGQFSDEVTPGKLRSAFKYMGFYGMVEAALFADILTLKEALEFDKGIQTDQDYVLTSCCCPLWITLIRKAYKEMIPHVPPSVSPMVACGRSIKRLHPDAKTIFVGPCLAKKAEAREPDIVDAVDYVLTFEEIAELFQLMNIHPETFEDDQREHSSRAGRIYARTGGVSEAVQMTLDRLRPGREIPLKAVQVDGVSNCRNLLKDVAEGKVRANFIEGMGCRGGCVGGPKSMIDKEKAREAVDRYGEEAPSKTPADNPAVLELLQRLGYDTVESLLERDKDFTRTL
ncbi:MAG: [Fe-Fe] hydrogenase large subunit C-terminal domain-containing protein [Oscillospiraceae bacterium]|jgi:iron only hydrogenase large subunit-like protein